jgi:hypothetical protein
MVLPDVTVDGADFESVIFEVVGAAEIVAMDDAIGVVPLDEIIASDTPLMKYGCAVVAVDVTDA